MKTKTQRQDVGREKTEKDQPSSQIIQDRIVNQADRILESYKKIDFVPDEYFAKLIIGG